MKIKINHPYHLKDSIHVLPIFHISCFWSYECAILVGWLWFTISIFIDRSPNKPLEPTATTETPQDTE